MKFLVDESVPPVVGRRLNDAGHDATHVYDLQGSTAGDARIISIAAVSDRVVLSAETDFSRLLASAHAKRPSVLVVRHIVTQRPHVLAETILQNLPDLRVHLESGAIVELTGSGVEIQPLPLPEGAGDPQPPFDDG